jgi:hypothetical protein
MAVLNWGSLSYRIPDLFPVHTGINWVYMEYKGRIGRFYMLETGGESGKRSHRKNLYARNEVRVRQKVT